MARIALACMLMFLVPNAPAQTVTRGSWASIQILDVGKRIQVHRFGAKRVTGRFVSADAENLVIRQRSVDLTIPRTDVKDARIRQASARIRNAAIMAAVAGGVVGGVTALTVRDDFNGGDGLGAPVTLVATMVAAGVTFAVGLITPGYGTIYKASK